MFLLLAAINMLENKERRTARMTQEALMKSKLWLQTEYQCQPYLFVFGRFESKALQTTPWRRSRHAAFVQLMPRMISPEMFSYENSPETSEKWCVPVSP